MNKSVVIVRNGHELCASCRDKGCMRHVGGAPDIEEPYEGPEVECQCCGRDIVVNDGLGV